MHSTSIVNYFKKFGNSELSTKAFYIKSESIVRNRGKLKLSFLNFSITQHDYEIRMLPIFLHHANIYFITVKIKFKLVRYQTHHLT